LEAPEQLLQVVLIGQLELRAKLKLPEMRQLDQRVSARCTLQPLGRDGVAGYISHRLAIAGGGDDRVHFSPNATDAIFRVSGGTPRVINLVCDRALHRGHLARKSVIDLEAVTQAIEDLGVGSLTVAPSFVAPPETPMAPAAEPVVPPIRPETAAAAPPPAAAPVESGRDLAGLEVQDIEESSTAPPRFSTPVYYQSSVFGYQRQRRRWRTRLVRWAAAASVMFGIVFFALFGEAVFIYYFPTVDEIYLRLPAAPAPPRVPTPNRPVSIPPDLLQPAALESLVPRPETQPSGVK
jgi:hypothetical protein